MKYDPVVCFKAAFEDDEGLFLTDDEFTDVDKCKEHVEKLNDQERKRLGVEELKTSWFVARQTTRVTVEWSPEWSRGRADVPKPPAPKKKVKRKPITK